MKRLVLLLCLIPIFAIAQQTITGENILTINRFGGLNTRAGDFSIKPNEFRELFNFDLDRNVGSLTKRFGYDSIGTIVGQDSVLGLYGAYYTDGSQQLIIVTDSAGVGYGNIYVTQPNSNVIDKDGIFVEIADSTGDSLMRIATYWSILNKPVFTMFEDRVYIVNGSGKGIIYDRDAAYVWPPNAPGEPTIVPLDLDGAANIGDTTTWKLDGEYRYMFVAGGKPFTEGLEEFGFPSYAVRVKNGRVLLKDFQWIVSDSVDDERDTVLVDVYRTKANPGVIDETDSAFNHIDLRVIALNISALGDSIIIDSIPDEVLGGGVIALVDTTLFGREADGSIDNRYGAPTFLSAVAGDSGIYFGSSAEDSIIGVMYASTFLDTATAIESPMGAWFRILESSGAADSGYTIGLPRIADGISGQKINIYRSHLLITGFDTSAILDSTWTFREDEFTGEENWIVTTRWRQRLDPNGIINGDWHLLDQVSSDDTSYFDDLEFDSLYYRPIYRPTHIRVPASYVFSAYDQLYAIKDNTLSFTSIDSSEIWFPTDAIIVNADDGDRIMAAYAARGVIRIFKSKSMYNLFQNANGIWNKQEVTDYIGVVAPLSLSAGINGVFYLTDNGVFREQEGVYKDRYFDVGLVSENIIELDTIPITNKADAVGFQYKNLYVLSLPSADFQIPTGNTFVRFGKSGAWGTWDLEFGGTTLYSTETSLSFVPGDTLYFFKPGGDDILRFGASEQDNGKAIPVRARSAPLLTQDMSLFKRINRVGLVIEATVHDTMTVQINNEEKDLVSPDIKFFDTRIKYQVSSADNGATIGRYIQYRLTNQSGDWAANTRIEGIELFWRLEGQNDDN